jgi:hypothetical protein
VHSRMLRASVMFVVAAVVTTGCGASGDTTAPPAAATTAAAIATTAAPSPTPAAPKLDAKAVVDALVAAKLPVTKVVVQTEDTDPNDLLGRPNGYVSRASFDVPGGDPEADTGQVSRGGAVEVFADAAGAAARKQHIQELMKSNPILGTEYDYVNGPVLLRITGKVKPSVAKTFESLVATLRP